MVWLIKHIRSRFGYWWPEIPDDTRWERIAGVAVAGECGLNQVNINPDRVFTRIKLRPRATDLEVNRWTLEFNDGSILNLSLPPLLDGTESKPVTITGKQLRRILLKFDTRRVARRGRLEIWAQP